MNKKLNFLFALIMSALGAFGQEHGLGTILMDKSAYEALPHPPLLKGAAAVAMNCPSVVMLNNPPIGDQGAQGSCVGWGVGYTALSMLVYPQYNVWNTNSERSPSYVYNQIKISNNCNDGAYVVDGLNLILNQGSCSMSLMPYNQSTCSTQPNSTQIANAAQNKAGSWSAIYPTTDVAQIKQTICAGYPVVVAFGVYESFYTMWNEDGIWDGDNSGNFVGGHCVCIIGYDDTKKMFKAQNQWGTGGGDNGYLWISYQNVEKGYLNEVYRVYPGCASNVIISGNYNMPLTESSNWIVSTAQTVIASGATVKLDANPDNGYIEFAPSSNSEYLLSAPSDKGVFIAQALDGCGGNVPVRYTIPGFSTKSTAGFTISPNPARNQVSVKATEKLKPSQVEVYDISGRKQSVTVQSSGDFELLVSWKNLVDGIYMLKITAGEQQEVYKLVVRN